MKSLIIVVVFAAVILSVNSRHLRGVVDAPSSPPQTPPGQIFRSLMKRSTEDKLKDFMEKVLNSAGKGCHFITKYVTRPVCNALEVTPMGSEAGLCLYSGPLFIPCLTIFGATRWYCETVGKEPDNGRPSLETRFCNFLEEKG